MGTPDQSEKSFKSRMLDKNEFIYYYGYSVISGENLKISLSV